MLKGYVFFCFLLFTEGYGALIHLCFYICVPLPHLPTVCGNVSNHNNWFKSFILSRLLWLHHRLTQTQFSLELLSTKQEVHLRNFHKINFVCVSLENNSNTFSSPRHKKPFNSSIVYVITYCTYSKHCLHVCFKAVFLFTAFVCAFLRVFVVHDMNNMGTHFLKKHWPKHKHIRTKPDSSKLNFIYLLLSFFLF